jgi:AcrR family transcriptional regulator
MKFTLSTCFPVTAATLSPHRPYHHGDLRNALVEAGVELAREGGPDAIVLREAARRVGVSPNAAYRHFEDLPDLIKAVARRALAELASAMQAEIDRCRPTGDDAVDAWRAVRAVGRAYVEFALGECGLFRTAFDRRGLLPPSEFAGDGTECSPQDLLTAGLQRLVETGLLPAAEVEAARMLAWSSVHGLSLLLLGPYADLPRRERDAMIDATLDQVGRGLVPGGLPARRRRRAR